MQTIEEQASHIRHLQEQLAALQTGQSPPPFGGTPSPRGDSFSSYRDPAEQGAPEPEIRSWIISAATEQSEDEDGAEETEDEASSHGANISQPSSGGSQRGHASRSLRSVTSTIPSAASPLGMMASLSIRASSSSGPKRGGRDSDRAEQDGVGLTEPLYFEKGIILPVCSDPGLRL
jgi:hypothetical protein